MNLSDLAMIMILGLVESALQSYIPLRIGLNGPEQSALYQLQDGQKGHHQFGDRAVFTKKVPEIKGSFFLESVENEGGFVLKRPFLNIEIQLCTGHLLFNDPFKGIDEHLQTDRHNPEAACARKRLAPKSADP